MHFLTVHVSCYLSHLRRRLQAAPATARVCAAAGIRRALHPPHPRPVPPRRRTKQPGRPKRAATQRTFIILRAADVSQEDLYNPALRKRQVPILQICVSDVAASASVTYSSLLPVQVESIGHVTWQSRSTRSSL